MLLAANPARTTGGRSSRTEDLRECSIIKNVQLNIRRYSDSLICYMLALLTSCSPRRLDEMNVRPEAFWSTRTHINNAERERTQFFVHDRSLAHRDNRGSRIFSLVVPRALRGDDGGKPTGHFHENNNHPIF